MKKQKIITLIILALGVAMALAGLVILFQSGTDHTGHTGGAVRASTSIEFGADFYTTSAQTTGLAANAVVDLYKLTSIIAGIFFTFVGSMDICVTLLLVDMKGIFSKEKFRENEVTEQNIID